MGGKGAAPGSFRQTLRGVAVQRGPGLRGRRLRRQGLRGEGEALSSLGDRHAGGLRGGRRRWAGRVSAGGRSRSSTRREALQHLARPRAARPRDGHRLRGRRRVPRRRDRPRDPALRRDGKLLNDIGKDTPHGGIPDPERRGGFQRGRATAFIHAANPGMHRVERYRPDGSCWGTSAASTGSTRRASRAAAIRPTWPSPSGTHRRHGEGGAARQALRFRRERSSASCPTRRSIRTQEHGCRCRFARPHLRRRHREARDRGLRAREGGGAVSEREHTGGSVWPRPSAGLPWPASAGSRRSSGRRPKDRSSGRSIPRGASTAGSGEVGVERCEPCYHRVRRSPVRRAGGQRVLQVRALRHLPGVLQYHQRGGRRRGCRARSFARGTRSSASRSARSTPRTPPTTSTSTSSTRRSATAAASASWAARSPLGLGSIKPEGALRPLRGLQPLRHLDACPKDAFQRPVGRSPRRGGMRPLLAGLRRGPSRLALDAAPRPAQAIQYERPVETAPQEETIGGGYATPQVQRPRPRSAAWQRWTWRCWPSPWGSRSGSSLGRRSRRGLVA